MKISYTPRKNFHNAPSISLIISGEEDGDLYIITQGQAQRIERHFCGIASCQCWGGGTRQLSEKKWGIPIRDCSTEY